MTSPLQRVQQGENPERTTPGGKMKKSSLALLAVATALAIVPSAFADTETWGFNVTGSGIDSNGTITIQQVGTTNTYEITSISGIFSDTNAGISNQLISGLVQASNPPGTGTLTSDNLFIFDNGFWPSSNAPMTCYSGVCSTGGLLDIFGLMFDVAGGYEFNIWGNNTGGTSYTLDGAQDGNYKDNGSGGVTVEFVATPEPGSLLLLGTGLLAAAFVLFRKAKSTGPSLAGLA
jgi:hypothetical protein